MKAYIIRRLLFVIPTLIGVSLTIFIVSNVLPGDPVALMLGPHATKEQVENLKQTWGIDKPIHFRYLLYVKGVILKGDFGFSLQTRKPVIQDLFDRFPASLELATVAMILSLLIGIPLGIISALKRNSLIDSFTRSFSLIGVSMPIFWLGFMVLLVFYLNLNLFSGGGRISLFVSSPDRITGFFLLDSLLTGNWNAFKSSLNHMVLPAFTLTFTLIAIISRITRSSVLEVLDQDYIRTARSKGLSEKIVILKHCLKNALLPIITVAGTLYGQLIGGLIVTEAVFSWPGVGRYMVQSILYLDFKPIMGFTIITAFAFVMINLVVDVLYAFIDPRIRYN